MMRKISLTEEQFDLLKQFNVIENKSGIFYNFPYWVKQDGEEGLYELYARSEIPDIECSYLKGGLEKSKYEIRKNDKSTMDPNAWYFVLRVDKDPHAQKAALAYAESVKENNPLLSEELKKKVLEFNPEADYL